MFLHHCGLNEFLLSAKVDSESVFNRIFPYIGVSNLGDITYLKITVV